MSKPLQFGIALVCLACVLAVCIAPSVDIPETVLQLHHSALSRAAVQSSGAVAVGLVARFHVNHSAAGFGHILHTAWPTGRAERRVWIVLRC